MQFYRYRAAETVEMRKFALAGLTTLLMQAQPSAAEPGFPREPGYGPEELALIVALFTAVQPRSIAATTEYCGYLFRDAAGRLRVSGPARGGRGGCNAPWPERGEPIASWHTHAGYDAGMWNEVPSARDLQADAFEGVDGWVATPGGRLWHVDGAAMVATLVCGPGCLPGDPDHDADATGPIGSRYSFDDLLDKFAAE